MRARLNDDVRIQNDHVRIHNDHVRIQNDHVFRISIDYILELLARFARSPTNRPDVRRDLLCVQVSHYV